MKHPNEERTIATMMTMGAESLYPEMFAQLEAIIDQLCEIRAVNIDNELLAAEYIKLSGKRHHNSDCRTSDAPAMQPGPCNCDYGV